MGLVCSWLGLPSDATAGDLLSVVSVYDGDTLTVLVDRKPVKVRLAEIDAPELRQAFGIASRDSLRALCAGQVAEVTQTGWDERNQRPVARVTCRETDVATHLVRNGMAWVWPRYAPSDSPLFLIQTNAKAAGRGLWVEPNPIEPWEWRKAQRAE